MLGTLYLTSQLSCDLDEYINISPVSKPTAKSRLMFECQLWEIASGVVNRALSILIHLAYSDSRGRLAHF